MEVGEYKGEDGEEEDMGITDVDDPIPLFTKPISYIPGELHDSL